MSARGRGVMCVIVVLVGAGCGDTARNAERSVQLVPGSGAGVDQAAFAQRQRSFLRAVTDSAQDISRYVRLDFWLHDEAQPDSSVLHRSAMARNPLEVRTGLWRDYQRLARGGLATPFHDSASYEVYPAGRRRVMVITHTPGQRAHITTWDSTPAGWRVGWMWINASESALASFQENARTSAAR